MGTYISISVIRITIKTETRTAYEDRIKHAHSSRPRDAFLNTLFYTRDTMIFWAITVIYVVHAIEKLIKESR